jgi:hypothetical protein
MSSVNQLLNQIHEVHALFEAQKSAEKGKIGLLREQALKLFEVFSSSLHLFLSRSVI